MSTSKYLACENCKQYAWIGQNSYIYNNDDNYHLLNKFLFLHEGCYLRFFSEWDIDDDKDWEELEYHEGDFRMCQITQDDIIYKPLTQEDETNQTTKNGEMGV